MKDQPPILFIHGLWLHSSSWTSWRRFFGKAGYVTFAPGWPGDLDSVEKCRQNPEQLANKSIDEVTAHYTNLIETLPTKPILIGHSFGGLIAQKLLGLNLASAAIAIDPAQIRGVLPLPFAQFKSGLPVLKNPLNKTRAISLTQEEFRYAFGNAIPQDESRQLYDKWTIPAPGRPLFQAALANFNPFSEAKVNTRNSNRGPLLMISGGQDHTVPDVVTRAAFNLYRGSGAKTDFKEFQDRGHSLTIDHGWQEIAKYVLDWLAKN